jgi:hypothetical protein
MSRSRRRRHCRPFSCHDFRKRAKKTRVAGIGCCPDFRNIFTDCHGHGHHRDRCCD